MNFANLESNCKIIKQISTVRTPLILAVFIVFGQVFSHLHYENKHGAVTIRVQVLMAHGR